MTFQYNDFSDHLIANNNDKIVLELYLTAGEFDPRLVS